MKKIFLFTCLVFLAHVAQAKSVDQGQYVALEAGYGQTSSSLTGTGFNSDLPGKAGLVTGLDLSYRNQENDIGYNFEYQNIDSKATAPASLTPSDVSLTREEIKFLISFSPWSSPELENLRLGLGYGYLKSTATKTLPNNIVTEQISQGAIFNATWAAELESQPEVLLNYEALIYLPHSVRESAQVTGYNPSYLGVEVRITAEYSFWNNTLAYAGVGYRTDQVSFDGSVSRGVTSGKDVRATLTIPVGIKFGY